MKPRTKQIKKKLKYVDQLNRAKFLRGRLKKGAMSESYMLPKDYQFGKQNLEISSLRC